MPASRRSFSLRLGLGTAFTAAVLLTSLLLGAATFVSVRSFIREGIRDRIGTAAAVAALTVDAELHHTILDRADEQGPAYRDVKAGLRTVLARTPDLAFIYTVRRGADGRVVFAVDSDERPDQMGHVGQTYADASPLLRAAFDRPYRTHVESAFYTDQWGTFLSAYAPILDRDGRLEAVLGVDMRADEIAAYEWRYIQLTAGTAALVSVAMALGAMLLAARISRPLRNLATDMSRIRALDLDASEPLHSFITEVVNMRAAVDDVKSGLRSFRKYVPADLVKELISLGHDAVLSAERREVSVLFSDIEGFTGISERVPLDRLNGVLAPYFEGMTRAILAEGGTVDKFIGDSVMAFWGAPHDCPDHALRACRAALQCQTFIRTLPPTQGTPLVTRIGINSGDSIVGNMGYDERLSYTVVGDTVNVASRLEALNKRYGTAILIGEHTWTRVRSEMVARAIDIVAVKGRSSGGLIYELLGERSAVPAAVQEDAARFESALDLYRTGAFAPAAAIFDELATANPDDAPARILATRCRQFIDQPPGDDWTGVTVLFEK